MKQDLISKNRSTHLKALLKNDIDYELPIMALLLVVVILLALILSL